MRAAVFAVLMGVLAPIRAASADVRLTKGPYVTGIFPGAADVRFELDSASSAVVSVQRDADPSSPPRTFESHDDAGMHVVHATGLESAARYAYSVRVGGALLGEGRFSTAPADSSTAPVTFLVYGDERTDPIAHGSVARAMTQVPSDFLVNTGDMVEQGGDADAWQTFFSIESPLLRERPLFVTIGNHELVDDLAGSNFARYFGFADAAGPTKLYGTMRFGLVRFFFLNAMHGWDSGEERDWLVDALTNADSEPGVVWRVAVTHHGPWSSGPHGPNTRLLQAGIPELLEAHQVDLLLSGHDHIYERGSADRIKYLVSGGGGAPLYRIDQLEPTSLKAEAAYHFIEVTATASSMKIVARRVDGTVLDRCGFGKGQPWDCDPPRAAPTPSPDSAASKATRGRCSCSAGNVAIDPAALVAAALVIGLAGLRRATMKG
jgi:hypothetical protein